MKDHPFESWWAGVGSDDYKHLLETHQDREAARFAWNAAITAASNKLGDINSSVKELTAPSNIRSGRKQRSAEAEKMGHASGGIMAVQEDLAGGEPELFDRESLLQLFDRED